MLCMFARVLTTAAILHSVKFGECPRHNPMASSGSKATKGDMFIDDLTHIQSFLSTQKRTVKKEAFKKMLDNQVGSWVARINNTNIQPAEAATIGELLGEGPWFDEHHELLSDALASKMAGAASGDSSTQRRPLQTLNSFASYLTESDLKLLSDPEVHNVNKVQKLVAKCVALGLHLPKETTTKQIIKTAIDCALDDFHIYSSHQLCVCHALLFSQLVLLIVVANLHPAYCLVHSCIIEAA